MKSLDLLKKHLHRLGVFQSNVNFRERMYDYFAKFVFYGVSVLILESCLCYFAITAEVFSEYVECFYYLTHVMTLFFSWYTIYLLQEKRFRVHIAKLEDIVASSKYKLNDERNNIIFS